MRCGCYADTTVRLSKLIGCDGDTQFEFLNMTFVLSIVTASNFLSRVVFL